jgi:hypothetical protein
MRATVLAGVAAACVLLAIAGCKYQPTISERNVASGAPPEATAPVVITIIVDQMAAWVASERWPVLPKDGGFARLLREGTYVRDMRYAHAVTDTAPGHAALHTGAVPRENGIVANEIFNAEGDKISILRNETTHLVYPHAIDPPPGASAFRLRVDTIADRLRAANGRATILGISIKDRGAIIPSGKKPTAAIWFDVKQVRFVSSSAYGDVFPVWAERRGDQATVLAALSRPWEQLPGSKAITPDDQKGEGDESGLGTTFPHRLNVIRNPGRVFRTVPASDDTLFGLALDGIWAERKSDAPALISLSLSANDYIGHDFGPDSWEAWDELLRLDRALATFLSVLDQRLGPSGYAVVLTADHGTVTMPEAARVPGVRAFCAPVGPPPRVAGPPDRWQRPCGDGHRLRADSLLPAVRAEVSRALGKGRGDAVVVGIADPFVLVSAEAHVLAAPARVALDGAVEHVLAKTPGVRRVFRVDDLPESCPPIEGDDALAEDARIAALVCRSVAPRTGEQSGGYYVVTQPGSFFDPDIVVGFGTSHGSPYLYDRSVPLIVRAPGRVRPGRVIEDPIDFRAFAKTTSVLLGIAPPPAAEGGRDLTH